MQAVETGERRFDQARRRAGDLLTGLDRNTEVMMIAQVQPVYVTFAVPATHLPTIKRAMTQGKLPVVATPQDADAQPATGDLTFIDNVVDQTTDTIKLKGTFQNLDRHLWPVRQLLLRDVP